MGSLNRICFVIGLALLSSVFIFFVMHIDVKVGQIYITVGNTRSIFIYRHFYLHRDLFTWRYEGLSDTNFANIAKNYWFFIRRSIRFTAPNENTYR